MASDLRGDTDRDVAARHAEIVGKPPRIAAIDIAEVSDDLAAMLRQMIGLNAAIASRDAGMLTDVMSAEGEIADADALPASLAALPEILRTMLHHPALFTRQTALGIQLLAHGTLSARDRELAILRVAWLCRAPYEWGEHVILAHMAGFTAEEVERITVGSRAAGWSEHDRAILRAVEELRDDAMISDATWAVLAETLDERQLIELPILIGQYQAVAYSQNSLRLRLHHDNPGLAAR